MLDLLSTAASTGTPPAWISWLPILGMVAIFWFLIIRPQMRQQKQHAEKIAALKKGDQVVTGGGFLGKVVKVDEHHVEVELAQGVRVRAVKNTIGDVVPPGGASAAND